MSQERQLRTGKRRGSGPPPGLKWGLGYLDFVPKEVRSFLDEDQYAYVIEQFEELARQKNPTRPIGLSIDQFENGLFYELREKWGVLGRIAFRGFFVVDKKKKRIVVIGAIKKEAEGKTPRGTVITMRGRARDYFAGRFEEV